MEDLNGFDVLSQEEQNKSNEKNKNNPKDKMNTNNEKEIRGE